MNRLKHSEMVGALARMTFLATSPSDSGGLRSAEQPSAHLPPLQRPIGHAAKTAQVASMGRQWRNAAHWLWVGGVCVTSRRCP